ncbi:hypothetical protein LK994_12055 [Ferruginibacter lapsinanis]|uniref:hypothetical protein n=1 Tax=Ferruginibacter lapsinanis TaxID=563172 RepID=UPI001E44D74C|nr:hypothetical protein [Ferruginibacter lapsinanis]UEG49365.1 hypothetical protein LK994_12055 [Ferruginibacter lapsinanis]
MDNKIKYYPVDNGDNSLIILEDGTSILVDCDIRQSSVDSTDPLIFDVKKDLLSSIKKRDKNPFVDIFILTHGDEDHCRGFRKHFYQGDPKKYSEKNRDANEIIIDEMWFSPMIAEESTNEEEDAYQLEAERRIELHRKKDNDRNLPGNRIKIIGYDGNKDYAELNHLRAIPGDVVTKFNDKEQSLFSIFIHAPFKTQLASADHEKKNTASIVFQARFKQSLTSKNFSTLAMFGGDADYIAWGVILDKTINSGKDVSENALEWDLFLAPHHCSWTFFNEHDNKDEPQESSLEVLKYQRKGGIVISSSKKIVDDDKNPPSYLAKTTYIDNLESSAKFLNTAIEPKESGPKPIEFIITVNGPVRPPSTKVGNATVSAGGSGAASTIVKQG